MPKQWAKVYRDCIKSDRLRDLLAKNPLAEALYWRLKAMSDDYGRYLGDPADVAAGVCPRNIARGDFRPRKVAQALADMQECGLIQFYQVGGKQYLFITDYFNHAHDRWTSIGKPEYPSPDGWQPPHELVEWLLANYQQSNACPERFGITAENWPKDRPYPWSEEKVGTPLGTPLPTPLGRGQTLDVDSDVDVDSDKEEDGAGAPAPTTPPLDEPASASTVADSDSPSHPTTPAPPAEEYPQPSNERGCKRPDGPMLLQNHACLADAVREVYGKHWSPTKQDDFVCDSGAALDEPGCTITEDEAIAALHGDGKPAPGRRGDWWIGDLCKGKAARERQARASPAQGRTVNAPSPPEAFEAALAAQREKLGEEVDSGPVDDPIAEIIRQRRPA